MPGRSRRITTSASARPWPWAEAVTNIKETHAPDDVYEKTRRHFNEKELADLTLAIAAINSWNRLAIAARSVPGKYQPARSHELHKSA
jgi:hypothetical protein